MKYAAQMSGKMLIIIILNYCFRKAQVNHIEILKRFLLLLVRVIFILIALYYSTTFITCPADPKKTLGIKLPFLVMIIKNLKKYFTFEVQVCLFCRIKINFKEKLS